MLVGVPFGGGSAIAYRPLAQHLPPRTTLYAASLPGHEEGTDEPLARVEDTSQALAEAILDLQPSRTVLYGHCVGVAVSLETTRILEGNDHRVDQLILAGSAPFFQSRGITKLWLDTQGFLVARGWAPITANTVGAPLPPPGE
ncbi:hypothetical protein GCM10027418_10520 [Mariniluteicoccus endophyticus]